MLSLSALQFTVFGGSVASKIPSILSCQPSWPAFLKPGVKQSAGFSLLFLKPSSMGKDQLDQSWATRKLTRPNQEIKKALEPKTDLISTLWYMFSRRNVDLRHCARSMLHSHHAILAYEKMTGQGKAGSSQIWK